MELRLDHEYIAPYGRLLLSDEDHIQQEIRMGRDWHPEFNEIIDKYIHKDSIVLDIGAHVGTFSLKCAKICKRVYAFEPQPELYKRLCYHIGINKINNIVPFNIALSDSIDLTRILWKQFNNLGGTALEITEYDPKDCDMTENLVDEHKKEILTHTIDKLCLPKIDFIKIDTEGCENKVINGGKFAIYRDNPTILAEFNLEVPELKGYTKKEVNQKGDYLYVHDTDCS
tara:strand:- start:9566 stop:10249 length:684 start_codon:yes stop_codon:yes gene_type:complete